MRIELPLWYDLHAHLRQDALLAPLIQAHKDMGCVGILAMPNTKPPVAVLTRDEETDAQVSIERYRAEIMAAGGDGLATLITPLYMTRALTPALIARGAESGMLQACKYYPPHGTTNSEFGAPLEYFIENGVFAAMEDHGVVLCIHGEENGLPGEAYFDRHTNAETLFYQSHMLNLRDHFPRLKIVCEHITTKAAADFVQESGDNIAGSVTPQHLLYTVGHLAQGLKYHLFCMPLVKFEEDRDALRRAVTAPDNYKFFAGTDSAPHTKKATECGCAAGCFTGGCAPQLYAQAFELAGVDLGYEDGQVALKRFLCLNGPAFYGLPVPQDTFVLEKKEQVVKALPTPEGAVVPLPLGMSSDCAAGEATIPWTLDLGEK